MTANPPSSYDLIDYIELLIEPHFEQMNNNNANGFSIFSMSSILEGKSHWFQTKCYEIIQVSFKHNFSRHLHFFIHYFFEIFIEMRIGKDFIRFNEFLLRQRNKKKITKELGILTLVCRRTIYFVHWHAFYDFGGVALGDGFNGIMWVILLMRSSYKWAKKSIPRSIYEHSPTYNGCHSIIWNGFHRWKNRSIRVRVKPIFAIRDNQNVLICWWGTRESNRVEVSAE